VGLDRVAREGGEDIRSTSVWSTKPIPPIAAPPTAIAKNVSGRILRACLMNVWPSDFEYGCGNRSRRLIQMRRLFACSTSDGTSSACHERTSQRASFRCTIR
jgi:hypothetical protein